MKSEIVLHAIHQPKPTVPPSLSDLRLRDLYGDSMTELIDGYRPWEQVRFEVSHTNNGDTLVVTDSYLPPVQRGVGTKLPYEKIPGGEDYYVVGKPDALTPGNILFTGYGFPLVGIYQDAELWALRDAWLRRLQIDEVINVGRPRIRIGGTTWNFGDIPHREGSYHRSSGSDENKQMAEIGYAMALLHHHMDMLGEMQEGEHLWVQVKTGGRLRHLVKVTKDRGSYFINGRPGNLAAPLASDLGVVETETTTIENHGNDFSLEDLLGNLSRRHAFNVEEILDRVTTAIVEIPDDRNSIAEPRNQYKFEVTDGRISYVHTLDGQKVKRYTAPSDRINALLQAAIKANLRLSDLGLILTSNPEHKKLWADLGLNPESAVDVETLQLLQQVAWLSNPVERLNWTPDKQAVAIELQRVAAENKN